MTLGASSSKASFLFSFSEDPVVVGIVERLLVVRIFRVPKGVVPRSFVDSDGTLKAREISDDEDCTTCLFNVGSFWAVGLKDVPLLVRGGS
jgi:hypothetical protein